MPSVPPSKAKSCSSRARSVSPPNARWRSAGFRPASTASAAAGSPTMPSSCARSRSCAASTGSSSASSAAITRKPRAARARPASPCCSCWSAAWITWSTAWGSVPPAQRGAPAGAPQRRQRQRQPGQYSQLPGPAERRDRIRDRRGAEATARPSRRASWRSSAASPTGSMSTSRRCRACSKSRPERSDLPAEINEHLVVELYSK